MPSLYQSLTLDDAKKMTSGAGTKAPHFMIPYNIAIVDADRHSVTFYVRTGPFIRCIDVAVGKSVVARLIDNTKDFLADLAAPGKPLFGIDQTNSGKAVIFGSGTLHTVEKDTDDKYLGFKR